MTAAVFTLRRAGADPVITLTQEVAGSSPASRAPALVAQRQSAGRSGRDHTTVASLSHPPTTPSRGGRHVLPEAPPVPPHPPAPAARRPGRQQRRRPRLSGRRLDAPAP